LISELKSKWSAYGFAVFAPLVALLLLALFQKTDWVQRLENLTVAFRFHLRSRWDAPADSRLLLVGIDQQSLDYLGAWPWPRTVEADFLKSIAASGMNPHTVAFDIMLTDAFDPYHDRRKAGAADMDQILGDAAGLLPSVVTGAEFLSEPDNAADRRNAERQTQADLQEASLTQPFTHIVGDVNKIDGSSVATLPIQPLRTQSLFGFVNDPPNHVDGIRYELPMVVRVGGRVYPSLAMQTLCQILQIDADKVVVTVGRDIVLRNSSGKVWTIPINDAGAMAINYRNPDGFSGISFKDLFIPLTSHAKLGTPIPAQASIDRKALIVGQTADALTDIGATPLKAHVPLVYTHFNAINNVLQSDYLRFVPLPWVVAGWLAVTWISLFRLRRSPIAWAVGLPAAVLAIYTLIAVAIFWKWSFEIALAWPVLAYGGVMSTHGVRLWLDEARSKVRLKAVFARMLSPEVMDHVLSHPDGLQLGGTTRSVTILFSDIRDYTKISEHIENEELVRQLNRYFEEMVECVTRHGGTFHKFIGDAIMAVWGDIASVSAGTKEDACRAVRAALEMRSRLEELNRERVAQQLLPLRIGIGLNFGDVLVGQIGAVRRSEFTVIGDPVNVASRLEGMTKEFRTDLAVGESVHDLVAGSFVMRRLGLVQLKGKSRPMMVFEVLGENDGDALSWSKSQLHDYHAALDRFLARDFQAAEAGFSECLKHHPDDSCVQRYLQASREFAATPPPPDWDGRVVMESK
jgi:adenylate cyclase